MAITKRYLTAFLIYLSFVCSGVLFAQPSAAPSRFTVAAHGVTPVGLVFERAPGKVESVEFRPGERSREYSASAPLVFYTVTVTPGEKAVPVRVRVASAIIPEGTKRALLLFVPNTKSATSGDLYRVLVFEDAMDVFPAASVRFLNASGLQLVGLINKAQVNFGADMTAAYPARSGVHVQLAMKHGDRLIPSFDQQIKVETTQRLICIFLPPESPKSPLVRWTFISDYIAPPPKASSS